ncbi:MAG TPA: hypothetical protein VM241_05685 [Candidatus Thermoplasmatota archaeon]|nr:hypothetical protein [Candidatus Thermoplasmatota archaeon]
MRLSSLLLAAAIVLLASPTATSALAGCPRPPDTCPVAKYTTVANEAGDEYHTWYNFTVDDTVGTMHVVDPAGDLDAEGRLTVYPGDAGRVDFTVRGNATSQGAIPVRFTSRPHETGLAWTGLADTNVTATATKTAQVSFPFRIASNATVNRDILIRVYVLVRDGTSQSHLESNDFALWVGAPGDHEVAGSSADQGAEQASSAATGPTTTAGANASPGIAAAALPLLLLGAATLRRKRD